MSATFRHIDHTGMPNTPGRISADAWNKDHILGGGATKGDQLFYDPTETTHLGIRPAPVIDVRDFAPYGYAWYLDDDVTYMQAAAAAAFASGGGLVVLRGKYLAHDTPLVIPSCVTFTGLSSGAGLAAGYGAWIEHVPSVAGGTVVKTAYSGTMLYGCGLENVFIGGSGTDATGSAIGLDFGGVRGGHITNVGIGRGFSTAALKLSALIASEIVGVNVGNSSQTNPCAAGLLWTGDLSTTTTVRLIYVHGGGEITDGIVIDGDACFSCVLDQPVVETITRYAYNIHKGNLLDIRTPYVEDCPRANAALPLFRIGKDSPSANYDSITNIRGGTLGGPDVGGYGSVFGFDLDNIAVLNVENAEFERITSLLSSTSTALQRISVRGCQGNNASVGTVGWPQGLAWDANNRGFGSAPASSLTAGAWADKPAYYRIPGQCYFATDANTNGSPRWWNGTAWVDSAGTVVA